MAGKVALQTVRNRTGMAAEGRLHSVAKDCFREAKLHRQLYGDELGGGKFASRPKAEVAVSQ